MRGAKLWKANAAVATICLFLTPGGLCPSGQTNNALAAELTKRIFPYTDNSVYEIICQPFKIVDLRLQPGEEIQALTAGDTERWKIGQATATDAGGVDRTHVLVKPVLEGIETNMVIITNRRTYTVNMKAVSPSVFRFDPVVEWSYEGSDNIMLIVPPKRQVPPPSVTPKEVESIVDEKLADVPGSPLSAVKELDKTNEALDFDYSIKPDGSYRWTPLHVFDDGLKTYILMPISVRSDEAPALFMVRNKKLTLVNYRIRGRWYIADRIMDRARLVIRDHDNIQKVEIVRHNRTSWWRKILPFV